MFNVLAGLLLIAVAARGQTRQAEPRVTYKTTVPLVLAPTTVVDRSGRPVTGLTASDFVLLDDGVAQPVHLEEEAMPVSLVIAGKATMEARGVQASRRLPSGPLR